MPLKGIFFQPVTNHVLGRSREHISMMEISTPALVVVLLFVAAFETLQIIESLQKEGGLDFGLVG